MIPPIRLNDLADSVKAGFLTVERIERWAKKRGHQTVSGNSPLGSALGSDPGAKD